MRERTPSPVEDEEEEEEREEQGSEEEEEHVEGRRRRPRRGRQEVSGRCGCVDHRNSRDCRYLQQDAR